MTNKTNHKPVLGVIGGMGPIASAQFVLTIYNLNNTLSEQQMPEVQLFSRPGIADRSTALIDGTFNSFATSLNEILSTADGLCDKMLICCFTAHNVWNDIPAGIRAKLINLVAYTQGMVNSQQGRVLLIATEGSYKTGLFLDNKPDNLILLEGEDIQNVHELIYRDLKHGKSYDKVYEALMGYCRKYGCDKILAGCSELHLLKTAISEDEVILDPLYEIAGKINEIVQIA
jgi:aspartate racemase